MAQMVKNPCNAGDPGSVSGLGRSPWERSGNSLQYSCLENSMDWWRGSKELDTTDWPVLSLSSRGSLVLLHFLPLISDSLCCFSCVWLFATPWTVTHQAPLYMGFSRQEYWSELPFPSPGNLSDPGIEPRSPALQADSLPSEFRPIVKPY